ncbi:MAG TPA: NCS2 family permease [Gammaproteobacteria bacterium]|jgi:AGZA family xanthine/uracil permease-like MFS transporter|nr:NCS2 family permease [Candidatus Hydrogenedentota bacterium]HJP36593.1 NCS2 family permease [Gammaproteobacteria bacterium]
MSLNSFFAIDAAKSTVRREIVGGLTTFATMSYIVFVQPTVLATTGMDFGAVLVATCLTSAAACFIMGFVAHFPFALAPGMGQNFLFAFTICGAMQFSWRAGLAIVFISGVIFLVLSLFGVREKIIGILPSCLANAIGPAIGLFIAFIGLQWSGIIVLDPTTMVTLGPLNAGPPLLALFGLAIMVALVARKVGGAILVGIFAACIVGVLTGVLSRPGETVPLSTSTMMQFGFSELAARWQDALIGILVIFFLDLFDTVGTLVGLSKQAGFTDEHDNVPGAGKVFFADASGSVVGALLGTSTVTTYIESATGIAAGARTGLAPVVTGVCFLGAMALSPFIQTVGADVGPAYYSEIGIENAFVAMYPGVAPALIIVGFMMLCPLRDIKWQKITEGLPAMFTITMMIFGFGITEGIAMGCISYTVIKILAGEPKDVHPIMYAIAAALTCRYAFLV